MQMPHTMSCTGGARACSFCRTTDGSCALPPAAAAWSAAVDEVDVDAPVQDGGGGGGGGGADSAAPGFTTSPCHAGLPSHLHSKPAMQGGDTIRGVLAPANASPRFPGAPNGHA